LKKTKKNHKKNKIEIAKFCKKFASNFKERFLAKTRYFFV